MRFKSPTQDSGTAKQKLFKLDELPTSKAPPQPISISDFLNMDFPERANLLNPWLPERGLSMVYAKAGFGKTWFVLGVAVAVANGAKFLRFYCR